MRTRKDFSNLVQLMGFFECENRCRRYLGQIRWSGDPVCPFCNHDHIYQFKDGRRYKCASKACRKKFTVTVGTIFENSKVSLRKWFVAIYLISNHKKGISSCQLGRDLGVSQKTGWFMLQRIREALRARPPFMLFGNVEIDECYVGGRATNIHNRKKFKYKAEGHYLNPNIMPVLGILQRGGMVQTIVMGRVNSNVLQSLILRRVGKKARIITDELHAYKKIGDNYRDHATVTHSYGEYVNPQGFHINTIEGFFSLLKRGIVGVYHQVSPRHLYRYCDEFCFRYNTRKMGERARFDVALSFSVGKRLKWKDLVKKF